MAGRSRSTFGKRQKEQKRQEKRQDKVARRDQRKGEKRTLVPGGEIHEDDLGESFADLLTTDQDDS